MKVNNPFDTIQMENYTIQMENIKYKWKIVEEKV
jgi:hypothetical protein